MLRDNIRSRMDKLRRNEELNDLPAEGASQTVPSHESVVLGLQVRLRKAIDQWMIRCNDPTGLRLPPGAQIEALMPLPLTKSPGQSSPQFAALEIPPDVVWAGAAAGLGAGLLYFLSQMSSAAPALAP